MAKRGRILNIFGNLKILKKNPWANIGMSTQTFYLATPPPWFGDASKLSPAQKNVIARFTDIAKQSIVQFPADGSFATLAKRVRWIGSQLKGASFGGKIRIPKSATAEYRAMLEARARR